MLHSSFRRLIIAASFLVASALRAAPNIVTAPVSSRAVYGQTVELQVVASGTGVLSYSWRHYGIPIAGATAATLTLAAVDWKDAGFYDVVVADSTGSATSSSARLVVDAASTANVYRPVTQFGPKLETGGGSILTSLRLPNGQFYVAGTFSSIAGATTIRLARFNADGTADPTFEPAVVQDGAVECLALQSDGKLIIGGTFDHVGGHDRQCLARLNIDGSLDLTFTTGSGFATQFPSHDPAVRSIAVQSDGRVLVAGLFAAYREVERPTLVRLNSDGTLDPGFTPPVWFAANQGHLVFVLPDDRILAAGSFAAPLVRLLPTGALDSSFTVPAELSGSVNLVRSLEAGKVLIAGTLGVPRSDGTWDNGFARLNSDGSVDETFRSGIGGMSTVADVNLLPDGRILAAGDFGLEGLPSRHQLARFSGAGALETIWHTASGGALHFGRALTVMADGSAFMTIRIGQPQFEPTRDEFTRFGANGTRDATFTHEPRQLANVRAVVHFMDGWAVGGDFRWVDDVPQAGLVLLDDAGFPRTGTSINGGFDGPVHALATDGLGRLLVGGRFQNYRGTPARSLVRLLGDGEPDSSFSVGTGFGSVAAIDSITLRPTGKIMVSGSFTTVNGVSRARLARLNADGALDTTFTLSSTISATPAFSAALSEGRLLVHAEADGIVRLNADGSRDSVFDTRQHTSGASALHVRPDESFYTGAGPLVTRSLPDGTRDIDFQSPPFVEEDDIWRLLALALDEQSRIYVTGHLPDEGPLLVQRFAANGARDATFRVVGYLPQRERVLVPALAFASNSHMLLGGTPMQFADTTGSGLVMLEAAPSPRIISQPVSQTAAPGGSVQFSIGAAGENVTYQWYHDEIAIPGATAATLTLTNLSVVDAGEYYVVVRNVWETVSSARATLRGQLAAPVITSAPVSTYGVAGHTATLQVTATGSGSLLYQWRKFGVPIPGATQRTLAVSPASLGDAGYYDVLVGAGLSVTTSNAAELRIAPAAYADVFRADRTDVVTLESLGGILREVCTDPNGKIYVGGSFTRMGTHRQAKLVRLNSDGSFDASFVPPRFADGDISEIVRQSDGKILVGGTFIAQGAAEYAGLVRLNIDGSIDASFRPDAAPDYQVYALVLQRDGKLLVSHSKTGHLSRLLPDGSADPAFANTTAFDTPPIQIAIQSDNRILVRGGSVTINEEVSRFVRLQANGALDVTFSRVLSEVVAFAVLPDDRIVVAHSTGFSVNVRRLSANGNDETFFESFSSSFATLSEFVLQPDGKVIAVGTEFSTGDGPLGVQGKILRYGTDGTLDDTYLNGPASLGEFLGASLTTDGRLWVAGSFTDFRNSPATGLVRLNASGAREPVAIESFYRGSSPSVVRPDAQGGWYVGGFFEYANEQAVGGLVRVREDGTIDPAFQFDAAIHGVVQDLELAGDGSILVAGRLGGTFNEPAHTFVRIHRDGRHDPSFVAEVPTGDIVTSIALLPDGAIAATSSPQPVLDTSVLRFRRDGRRDPDYAPKLGRSSSGTQITSSPDGRLYVGAAIVNGVFRSLIRLQADGTVDDTFTLSALIAQDSINGVTTQLDEKVLISGRFDSANPGSPPPRSIARLLSSGELDPAFDWDNVFDVFVMQMLVQRDGRILAGGFPSSFTNLRPLPVTRRNADGTIDENFAIQGLMERTSFVTTIDYTSDGCLMLGGAFAFEGFDASGLVLLQRVATPVIVDQPIAPAPVAAGASPITLTVDVADGTDVTYQWQARRGSEAEFSNIAGATAATLTIPSPQTFHAGEYRVLVSSSEASIASSAVNVAIAPGSASSDSRLLNLSTRALAQTGDQVLIPGFVIAGSAPKRLLIRAVGPTLQDAPINFSGTVLPDPRLRLRRWNSSLPPNGGYEDVTSNDNWGTNANASDLTSVSADLGAFALTQSLDAALLIDLAPGQYTAVVDDPTGASGVAVVELYDADAGNPAARLINISNRGFAGTGDQVMIPGFVVSSEGPKTFLIRAVGPTLATAPFHVGGVMADPALIVYRSEPGSGTHTAILDQDNWTALPNATVTAEVAAQLSAFPLLPAGKDAAFVVTLPPGIYTVHGKSADNVGTGVLLVEVYVAE